MTTQPRIDPRMPRIIFEGADGGEGVVCNMMDTNGRDTFDPRDAVVVVVYWHSGPNSSRYAIVQVTPDHAPATSQLMH